jgi:hypothetical protein
VLVVTKLDRLARSVTDLGQLMTRLEEKRVALRILGMGACGFEVPLLGIETSLLFDGACARAADDHQTEACANDFSSRITRPDIRQQL